MAAVLDRPQINLANVKTSITSIVEAQLDKINTMESSREIFLFIRNLFDEYNIDTKKSRDIIQNLATMRNVENARAYIYNFCLKGEGQGTLEIDKKPRYKSKMLKIDEKLKKIVSEEIEKIEVKTQSEEITVETDKDLLKIAVEPVNTNNVETSADNLDYEFFSDLNPDVDIDDVEVDAETEDSDEVQESVMSSYQCKTNSPTFDFNQRYDVYETTKEGKKKIASNVTYSEMNKLRKRGTIDGWISVEKVKTTEPSSNIDPELTELFGFGKNKDKDKTQPEDKKEEPKEEPKKDDEPITTYTYDEWNEAIAIADNMYAEDGDWCKEKLWSKIISLSACENLYYDITDYMDAFYGYGKYEKKGPAKNINSKDFARHLEEGLFGKKNKNNATADTKTAKPGKFDSQFVVLFKTPSGRYDYESQQLYKTEKEAQEAKADSVHTRSQVTGGKDKNTIVVTTYGKAKSLVGKPLKTVKENINSIKEAKDINPDIWLAIGRKFDYMISERAAGILENLVDRALLQDSAEDIYTAVISAIDEGLFNSADIWEINALYDECELSDNAYGCLIDDLVELVNTVNNMDEENKLTEKLDFKYIKALKDKIDVCYTQQDLEEIGADLTEIDEAAIERILAGDVTEADIEKMFGHYDFVPDDFGLNESKSIKESYQSYDIMLEEDDCEIDFRTGELKVSIDVFDDFAQDSVIKIKFVEEPDVTYEYKMISVNDEYITMAQLDRYNDELPSDLYNESKSIEETSEEPTVYLARAMHKMYIDGYSYQEIADELGAPVSLVIEMIGPDSYDESLTESTKNKLTESFNLDDYRNMENAEYEKDVDSEIVRTYTVYLPTTEGKDQIDICITRDFEADIDESDDGAWYIGVDIVGTNIDWRKLEDYLKTNYSSNIYATKYYWSDVIQDAEVIVQALIEIDQDDINQFLK